MTVIGAKPYLYPTTPCVARKKIDTQVSSNTSGMKPCMARNLQEKNGTQVSSNTSGLKPCMARNFLLSCMSQNVIQPNEI